MATTNFASPADSSERRVVSEEIVYLGDIGGDGTSDFLSTYSSRWEISSTNGDGVRYGEFWSL